MTVREHVSLASLTTLRVGGLARFAIDCASEQDVLDAIAFANERGLPLAVLGEGSNVLADDRGYAGVLLLMRIQGIESSEEETSVIVTAGAGVAWDDLVDHAARGQLWGLENLAGIPGTVGASPVQNIGAYGAEAKDTLVSVRVLDLSTQEIRALTNEDCAFGYRDSRFKRKGGFIILSVSFRLARTGAPALRYKDLAVYSEEHGAPRTPAEVGAMVRAIRAKKFPDLREHGTAGSFFKNPTISTEAFEALRRKDERLPGFPNENGVKVPLAFVLDKLLGLRGFTEGNVSLFQEQPLVLVTRDGATSSEVDSFAKRIEARVLEATGISIEREVRMFP
ncbi:MAG: UDP-N-acetylmuramate dehydrogenase [Patescibacteria group bacterium]